MTDERNEQDVFRQRMESLGAPDYELKGTIVFWKDEEIGSLAYLVSRRMDQLAGILDQVRSRKDSKPFTSKAS